MKSKHILFTAIGAFLLSACASQNTPQLSRAEQYKQSKAEEREEGDRPPRKGMTKDQVVNQYGRPVNISSNSRGGEIWVYSFNNFDGRDLIPYYGSFHSATKQRHSGTITFNSSGRVSDFQWNESNPMGGTIWR